MRNIIPFLFFAAADDLQSSAGAIGKLGTYSEEITKDGHLIGAVTLGGDLVPAIPGAVKVEGGLKLIVDPVAVILFEAQKIKNPVADWIAKELLAMRNGAAPAAALVDAHAAAVAAAPSA